MVLDNVIFPNLQKYLHTSNLLHMKIKKALLYYLIKIKPHHTKSIVQYSDGSCDTFEMQAVDNMLELAPNEFSAFDREFLQQEFGVGLKQMQTFDHLNLFQVDHQEQAEAGVDCTTMKSDHGLLDTDYFHELVQDNEELRKYDHDNSWWLNENDILSEQIMKQPFKLDLKAGNKILANRLNGAKRLDRVNRILFESSMYKDSYSWSPQLSEDRKWLLQKHKNLITRFELLTQLHQMTNHMVNQDNFWVNCQDWSSAPLKKIDPL